MSLHRRNSRANDFRKLTGVRLTDSRWRFQSVGAASCADRFGVAFRFLLNFFQVSWLYAARTHTVFLQAWRTFERCPLPDPVQSVGWKLLNFQQFLPMGEEAVPLAMIHNAAATFFAIPGSWVSSLVLAILILILVSIVVAMARLWMGEKGRRWADRDQAPWCFPAERSI